MTSELWLESEGVVPSYVIILAPGSDLSEFSARYPGCSRRRLDLQWPLQNTRRPLRGRSWSPLGPNCPLSSLTLASEPCCWRRAPSQILPAFASSRAAHAGLRQRRAATARKLATRRGACARPLCLLPGRSSALPLPRALTCSVALYEERPRPLPVTLR